MTVLFRQTHLFYIPNAAVKLLLWFSAPRTFSTSCREQQTTISLSKHEQHGAENRHVFISVSVGRLLFF